MKYCSTRGETREIPFKEAVMMGLARDGGLLVPGEIPDVRARLEELRGCTYTELALRIMSLYVDDIPDGDLGRLVEASYATFVDERVTPLVPLGDFHLMELFHGPTLAFKDVALQFLGNLFEYILAERGSRLNIIGATSGDTGSAAIAGVRGRENIDIFIMFPEGRTSPIQERQMTTVLDPNVHNIAVEGSFDDCQFILKSLFADLEFRDRYHLGAVNSVNWARVLAQIVYYFSAWFQLDHRGPFDVCVPTGNFGNIFAAYLARRMGLPIDRLILATNENDILSTFFNTGVYKRGEVRFSVSPAMNIQVASNFERYLFYRLGSSGEKVRAFMERFAATGEEAIHYNTPLVDEAFRAGSASDDETLAIVRRYREESGYWVDPHTAVGLHVAERFRRDGTPMVCMATAHPAKFLDVIGSAVPDAEIGHPFLDELADKPVRKVVLPAEIEAIRDHISATVEP